jgi:hypothetical protein
VTLIVSGPSSIQVLLPRGQTIDHDGRRTVWMGTMTDTDEREVVGVLRAIGLEVSVHSVDPDDGSDERTELHTAPPHGVGRLPTLACPSCAWLDYGPEGFECGVGTWNAPAKQAFNHGKAADDLAACPAGRTVTASPPAGR